jgi:hypothetical protein
MTIHLKLLAISFCAALFSIFFAKPKLDEIYSIGNPKSQSNEIWEAQMLKKEKVFAPMNTFSAESHNAKMAFRITVPILMKLFDLKPFQVYLLQLLIGLFTLFFIAEIIYSRTISISFTSLFVFAFASTYFYRSSYIDFRGTCDSFAYFFIIICLWGIDKPLLLAPSLMALFFTDERGIVAFLIVFTFAYVIRMEEFQKGLSKLNFKTVTPFLIIGSVFILSLLLRIYFKFNFNLSTPNNGADFQLFRSQWAGVQLGLFSGISGLWILILVGFYIAISKRQFLFGILIGFNVFVFVGVASVVSDVTRSLAYLAPMAIVSLIPILEKRFFLNYVLLSSLSINILFPCLVIIVPLQLYYYPILFDFIFKILSIFNL